MDISSSSVKLAKTTWHPMELQTKINWNNLTHSVQHEECILVLGPHMAMVEMEGKVLPLLNLLANHLAQKLNMLRPELTIRQADHLAYIANELEDALMPVHNFNRKRARNQVGALIQEFYAGYDHTQFPVFQQLAKLPFRFVVNTSWDHFLLDAYFDENKLMTQGEFYHFRNPKHNNDLKIRPEDIIQEAPLVSNLFGSINSIDSMVITENDQLYFLDAILQREKTATIPADIAIHFTSTEKYNQEKTFVFLGFDFNQWHLRLLLHLINRYQRQKESYALQNPKNLSDLTTFFYKRNFEVEFVDIPSQRFLARFAQELEKEHTQEQQAPQLRVFTMYDPIDQPLKAQLDAQLEPLKREAFIQTWDEGQLLAGTERKKELKQQIQGADLIILIITANFFASDEIYLDQLQLALERHNTKEAVVIPILMRSCNWDTTQIKKLPTILPRNRLALNDQENEDRTLTDIIDQLEKFCNMIYQRKEKKAKR